MQLINFQVQETTTNLSEVLTEDTYNAIFPKTILFTAYQDGIAMCLKIEGIDLSRMGANMVCGTLLDDLFAWVTLQKELGADGLKLNQPINLRFDVNGIAFDSGMCDKKAVARLKLQNTDKGRKAYARKFWKLFKYSTRTMKVTDINQLIGGMETALLEESKAA